MLRAFCSPSIDFCAIDEMNVLCFKRFSIFLFCYLFILNFFLTQVIRLEF